MKVYVMPADAYACGHYRLIWPADALKRQGFDVTIVPPNDESGFLVKTQEDDTVPGGERIVDVNIPQDADVFVLQRPAHPLQPQLIARLRAAGIAVVVDMDDDMSSIHPNNVAYRTYHPRSTSQFNWRHAAESCKVATMVTASTRALEKTYARPGYGVVLDNYVPATTLTYEASGEVDFGWAGTTQSHPNDLQDSGKTVQRLIDEGHTFKVVGGVSKVKAAARLTQDPEFTGTVGLEKWVKTIGETYQVGMIPLSPSAFNTAKSRLKGIEHFAAGVPWVASPRDEYRRLVREAGAGLLASTPKEWYTQLKRLLSDGVLYKEQVEAGRGYMKTQTYEGNCWRWAEAWDRAYQIQRGTFTPTPPRG